MLKIELHDLWFHANHGLYEEERVLGGDFLLDVDLYYAPAEVPARIAEAIDYTAVYNLVKKYMEKPEALLENLAVNMANAILNKFPAAGEITISVKKVNPPLAGFTGSVKVAYTANRGKS